MNDRDHFRRPLVFAVGAALTGIAAVLAMAIISAPDRLPSSQQRGIDLAVELYQWRAKGFAEGFLSHCGEPCVIDENGGGIIVNFEALAARVVAEKRHMVIGGKCASACALLADLARARLCILPAAYFLFHRDSANDLPPDSADIMAWVEANGGFPAHDDPVLTKMNYDAAQAFFRPCCRLRAGTDGDGVTDCDFYGAAP